MDANVLHKATSWLQAPFDTKTQVAVQKMMAENPAELAESFYTDLDFGTGGLRGIMGIGTNRINRYTLGQATQGLANYLNAQFPGTAIKVAIAYDCRNNSNTLAREVAGVLAANNIHVYLFEALRPTPLLSFAVRHLGCQSGIVLTASHNPKEYNGYKAYWNDGGQLVPPHDKGVIEEVRKVAFSAILFDGPESNITHIGAAVDQAFLAALATQTLNNTGKKDLKVVFTNLHGTAGTLVPQALAQSGFTQVFEVAEQAQPDGNFPTVHSPNPEEGAALKMAVDLANEVGADLVIGTDPDADRVGIAVRNLQGELVLLNGNQTASVLVHYVLDQHQRKGTLAANNYVAATIVTTDLIRDIAQGFGVNCYTCLTGFKWIAEIIRNKEGQEKYLVGGEESYGYLIGDFVRDKDAVTAAVVLAEIAAYAKHNGGSFYEELLKIYQQYGYYLEDLVSITKKGKSGTEEIATMMQDLRTKTPTSLAGVAVTHVLDYNALENKNLATGAVSKIDLPKSNVIQLLLADGSKITARPSGTEPKIKFYFSVKAQLALTTDFDAATEQLRNKIQEYQVALQLN